MTAGLLLVVKCQEDYANRPENGQCGVRELTKALVCPVVLYLGNDTMSPYSMSILNPSTSQRVSTAPPVKKKHFNFKEKNI